MAISIDWGTKVITVPKADTQLVQSNPIEIRQLDLDAFRLELKALEASYAGMPYEKTHVHNTTVTVGGVTLARVIEIINGYTITFENGSYGVNLVGANSNVADVTNLNNVQIRSANSAGLTFSEEINNQSFVNASVCINIAGAGLPGTQFPRGTPTSPVNNYADAIAIAAARNYSKYEVMGTELNPLFIPPGDDISHTEWYASTPLDTAIVLQNNTVDATVFTRVAVTGLMNGIASFEECSFSNLSGFQGLSHQCGFLNTVVCDATATDNIVLNECLSVIAGLDRVQFDCNNTSSDIHIRGWKGGIDIDNFTDGNNMSLDVISGTVEIKAGCTDGVIVVRGNCVLIDNSGPGCDVHDLTVESKVDTVDSNVAAVDTKLDTKPTLDDIWNTDMDNP